MRYKFKIRGKNGIPNPFKGIEVKYADGSFVSLKYENSQVTICDSREKNVRRVVEADNFIRDIMRE